MMGKIAQLENGRTSQKWSKNKLTISWQSFNSRFVSFRLPDWSNSALHAANWLSFMHFRKIFEKFRQKFPSYEYQYYHFLERPYDTKAFHRLGHSIVWSLKKVIVSLFKQKQVLSGHFLNEHIIFNQTFGYFTFT